jgi:hypothetical protein
VVVGEVAAGGGPQAAPKMSIPKMGIPKMGIPKMGILSVVRVAHFMSISFANPSADSTARRHRIVNPCGDRQARATSAWLGPDMIVSAP